MTPAGVTDVHQVKGTPQSNHGWQMCLPIHGMHLRCSPSPSVHPLSAHGVPEVDTMMALSVVHQLLHGSGEAVHTVGV